MALPLGGGGVKALSLRKKTFFPAFLLGGRQKLDFLGDISPIRGGGSRGKSLLFLTKCNLPPFNLFFIKTFILYCLSTGSNEIIIKK